LLLSRQQKKPKDKPKRPLSAYNFFFKEEREKILKVVLAEDPTTVQPDPEADDFLEEEHIGRLKKEGGKVSFEEMGKIIGQRWKNIDPDRLSKYSEMAAEDTERYKTEMQAYNGRQEARMRQEALKPPPTYTPAAPPQGYAPQGLMPGGADPSRGGYPDQMGQMAGYGSPGMAPGGYGSYGGGMDFNGYGSMGYGMGAYGGAYGMPAGQMDPNMYGGAPAGYGQMGMMGGFQGSMMGYGGAPPDYGAPPQQQQQHPMDQHQQPPPHGGMYGGYGGGPPQGWGGQ
jgi:hypothetical protein